MRLRIENYRLGLLVFVLLTGAVSTLTACGDGGQASPRATNDSSTAPVKVVTTLPLLADFVRQIGADDVELLALLPSGADPHTFQPSPRDVQKITEADAVVVNGLGLETPALAVIEPNLSRDASLVTLAEEAREAGASILAEGNPHLWLDIANAEEYARIIRDALAEVDPDGTAEYEANYQRFLSQLDELDRYVRAQVSFVPPERRKLVTTHEAFPYLARYLGLKEVAVVVPSPGQEPSPQDIADLGRAIRQEGVPAVFAEPQLGPESAILKQAAADAGVQVCTLYSGPLDDKVGSYLEMMRFNADEIARCLGGVGG